MARAAARRMRLSRWAIGVGITVATLSPSSSARAEEGQGTHRFGSPGFIVSADRLLPLISYQSIKTSQDDGSSDTQSRLSIALMNNGPYGVFSSFYNLPRLGFDWLPIRNLTLGGAAWFYADLQASNSTTPAGGGSSTSTDQPKVTYWGIAPRVGYIIPMGDKLSLWPRAGIEYHNVATSSVGGSGAGSVTQFAIEGEAMLVISPWNHFGFTVGPTVDVPISGEQTTTTTVTTNGVTTSSSTRVNSAMFQVGLSAGMLGHF
jgi:opacity protein-like surface antigen